VGACPGTTVVVRDYVFDTTIDLRHREVDEVTDQYYFGGQHTEEFDPTFFTLSGEIMRQLMVRAGMEIDWVGDIGVGVCKAGRHGEGRAFDLGRIVFADGTYIDANEDWRDTAPVLRRRKYFGLVAQCRLVVGTVLTGWYLPDPSHQNHIHFDNGVPFVPLRTTDPNITTDPSHVQAACNILNGESLAIDGVWGPETEDAYNRLRAKLKVECTDPKTNAADATLFLGLIAKTGLKGKLAGAYVGCC
jgi:hypothetical protein